MLDDLNNPNTPPYPSETAKNSYKYDKARIKYAKMIAVKYAKIHNYLAPTAGEA